MALVPPNRLRDPALDASRVAAALLALIVVPLALAAAGQPISARGTAWLVLGGLAVLALGIGTRPARSFAVLVAFAWIFVVVATLAWPAPAADPSRPTYLERVVLPDGEPASRLGRIFAERDVSLVGVRVMHAIGAVGDHELEGFEAPLAVHYDAIEASDGELAPTPFLSTALGSQSSRRFDAFVHHAPRERGEGTTRWVVFLHGYGGSFASYCWIVAHAAERAGASTICPATSLAGRWADGHGPAIARATLDWARAHGARSIVLAGLSNGGAGASLLVAGELRNERDVAGLALISGLDERATRPSIPTLVWHGTHDLRFPIARVRAWASTLPDGTRVEVEGGDHFALVEREAEFSSSFASFLGRVR